MNKDSLTDKRDTALQDLFIAANNDLPSEEFTLSVMGRMRQRQLRRYAIAAGFGLISLIGIWFLALPVQTFVQLLTALLTQSLFDFGDTWLSWLLAPINNIASLLVLSIKLLLSFKKMITGRACSITPVFKLSPWS